MYGLEGGTNFRDPHEPDAEPANVLYLPQPLEQLAKQVGEEPDSLLQKRRQINAQMKQVRDQRDQPSTDDKVLVEWNGMMIAGLARTGQLLEERVYSCG